LSTKWLPETVCHKFSDGLTMIRHPPFSGWGAIWKTLSENKKYK
jgi:hypothetical protein